ncbi:MAG: aldo/keto reductase [Deinococcota bacterium]
MTSSVPRTQLAANLNTAQVITGLWQIADMERDGASLELAPLANAMHPYVEAGLTTFDMADHYGSAEDIAGQYHTQFGHEGVQMLTKWVPEPTDMTKEATREAVERALKRMNNERLDLLQFHTWRYADAHWLDCLGWLQELKEEGLIANLGLTNVDAAHLNMVLHSGIEVVSNQVSCSLIDRRAQGALTKVCLEHGVKLLAYGTVAGGLLTERWHGQPEPKEDDATWSQMKYARFIDQAGGWQVFQDVLDTVHDIATCNEVSMANVASRYVLEQPAVGAIIIGARLGQRNHLEDTLKLFEFSLTDEDKAQLEAALTKLSPMPGDCGDEYRKPPFLTASGDLSHHLQSFPPPFEPIQTPQKTYVLSGTTWETFAGYCRAVRVGEHINVSGTTASHGDTVIGGQDAAAQTHFVIDKLEAALLSLGGTLEDVIRTRVFVDDITNWEAVAQAHGERFRDILPANTLVQAKLVGSDYLVEIEAEAIVRS